MIPLSCSNCWYNGLQYGSLGLTVGYCTEHRVVLRRADETTCRRQLRKDLMLTSALQEKKSHAEAFPDQVVPLRGKNSVPDHVYFTAETNLLRHDTVGELVCEYGDLGTKIESLAQLRRVPGARAEVGLLSLGRAYVNRCVHRNGVWTSGLHLMWWVRSRLDQEPDLGADDLRYQAVTALDRQVDLVRWAVMMLRLTFLSDLGEHAVSAHRRVSGLRSLAEDAAVATETTNFAKLKRWVKREALPRFDRALPAREYRRLAAELRDRDAS